MTTPTDPAHPRPPDVLHVVAWPDDLLDATGMDPRSAYVEAFWLPVLGPSATWLLRCLARGLEACPGGFDLPLEDTARSLGLGGVGSRHSPFQRAILRCGRYGITRHLESGTLAVRRRLAPVPHRHVLRFPPGLRLAHEGWERARSAPATLPEVRRRARELALAGVAAEASPLDTGRRLAGLGVHPSLIAESVAWAWARRSGAPGAGAAGQPGSAA